MYLKVIYQKQAWNPKYYSFVEPYLFSAGKRKYLISAEEYSKFNKRFSSGIIISEYCRKINLNVNNFYSSNCYSNFNRENSYWIIFRDIKSNSNRIPRSLLFPKDLVLETVFVRRVTVHRSQSCEYFSLKSMPGYEPDRAALAEQFLGISVCSLNLRN